MIAIKHKASFYIDICFSLKNTKSFSIFCSRHSFKSCESHCFLNKMMPKSYFDRKVDTINISLGKTLLLVEEV